MRAFLTGLVAAGFACGSTEIPEIAVDGMERPVADAIRSTLDATREAPGDPARWLRLGMILHAHRLETPAAAAYTEAARLDEGDHRPLHLHGRMVEAGEPALALELAREAIRRRPGFAPSLVLQARTLETLGKDATPTWEALQEAAPGSLEARLARARGLLAGGQIEAARHALGELLALHPSSTAGWALLAQALSMLGKSEAASDAATRARHAARSPSMGATNDPDPLLLQVEDLRTDRRGLEARARRAAAGGNHPAAEALYRRLVTEHPESANLHYNHANALVRLGRSDEAEAAYREALSRDPDSSPVLANLANLLARTGRNTEADALYRRSAAADPDHLPTLLGASSLHFQRGDLEEAERLLRQVLDRNPDHPAALQGMGQLLATGGRLADAAAVLTRALEAMRGEGASPGSRAGIHFLLADVERRRGRRTAALAHLARAETLGMEIPPAFRRQLED